ncbi:hypothetical protein HNY73_009877 [Argiope bruennichi]|uniref:Uncharacterized protein n=1 Tax=Argiope bruennichi TaxID=94029 RepID=A0A8T0FBT4_ARGBR|nr:hypothetical protein HNY73_009877 [Argiope bruennichi]
MPLTRAVDEQLVNILAAVAGLKKSTNIAMAASNDSTNSAIDGVKDSTAIAEIKESTDVAVAKVDSAVTEITKMSSRVEQVEKSDQDVRESTTAAIREIEERIQQLETKRVPKAEGATDVFDCPRALRASLPVQFKSRRQRSGECLQELVSEIERLSLIAFPDCPTDIRDIPGLEYFVDAIRDPDIQTSVRLSDAKDLKSALVFHMKVETTHLASGKDRHSVRTIAVQDTTEDLERRIQELERLLRS